MHSYTVIPSVLGKAARVVYSLGSSLKRLRESGGKAAAGPAPGACVRAVGGVRGGPPVGPPRGGNGSYSHCSARRARGGGRGSGLRRAPREASYRRAAGRRTRCGAAPGRQPRHPITSSLSPVRRRHLRPRAREARAPLGPGRPASAPAPRGPAARRAPPSAPRPGAPRATLSPSGSHTQPPFSSTPCPGSYR